MENIKQRKTILNKVYQAGDSSLQELASSYMDDLANDDRQLIAEAHARWALGDRKIAVKVVKKPLINYMSSQESGSHDELILWASQGFICRKLLTLKN